MHVIASTAPVVPRCTRRVALSIPPIASVLAPFAPALASSTSYDTYAPTYDVLDGGAAASALGFPDLRAALLRHARGDVLEVGVGTGLNLPLYTWQTIATLTAVDLSPGMLEQARAKLPSLPRQDAVTLRAANVTAMPFNDEAFDCVVDTFSMCVFVDPAAALVEMGRVLKPGGRLLLLEHSRSDNPLLGWYQDVSAPAVAATGKGCYWNQRVVELVDATPGVAVQDATTHLGGLLTSIVAVKRGT